MVLRARRRHPENYALLFAVFFAVTFFVAGFVTFTVATFLAAGLATLVAVFALAVTVLAVLVFVSLALVVLAAGFLPPDFLLTGPFATLAAINSSASSSVIASGETPLGSVALILPWRASGPW